MEFGEILLELISVRGRGLVVKTREFYEVVVGFTGFYRVLPGFTGFYFHLDGLPGFFYWVSFHHRGSRDERQLVAGFFFHCC